MNGIVTPPMPIVGIAAGHVGGPILRGSYSRNYSTNFENLENRVRDLQGRREAVQHEVDEAKRNGDEIYVNVQTWLDDANDMIIEATAIIEDNRRLNMRWFKGWKRHNQSKKAWKKTVDVSKLLNEGTFDRVSYRTLPAETDEN